jgi:hypothetical protein
MDIRVARMQDRIPGQLLIEKVVADTRGRLPGTALQRIFGLSPIRAEDRSWFTGAIGEQLVAEELRRLPSAWTVFHSLPVGMNDSDVDHVAVGPGGVFVLNAKHHAGKKIHIRDRAFLVSGFTQTYVRDSEHEATAVTRMLSARLPWIPAVRPVIVLVNPGELTVKQHPEIVEVQTARGITKWLRRRPETLSADQVDQIIDVLDDCTLWRAVDEVDLEDVATRYAEVTSAHRRAVMVSTLWKLAGIAVAVVAVIEVVTHLQL